MGLARAAASAEQDSLAGKLAAHRDELDEAFAHANADLTTVMRDLSAAP